MLELPVEILCGGILSYLSVCDLPALDTAFTNKYLRQQLRQVWKSYQCDAFDVILQERQVEWLNLIGVQIISVNVVCELVSASESIIMTITNMKRLRIKHTVCDTMLLQLGANNPNLVEVYVDNVYGPNIDNGVSALAQNCRQLHTLHINCKAFTDAGISALAQYCSQLHTLHLVHVKVTDAGIQALCDNCPHLKYIGLSYCHNLTDASLIAITNSYSRLQSAVIHLDGLCIESNNFTDDGFICFADKCHELRSVSVSCNNITSRGLTALWAANPNLTDVDVSHNRFISDDDIIQLVQCCPLLQKLNISRCYDITDAAVISVAEHCPQLRTLYINYCKKMSDASLIALGQHCHELKSIDISWLKNISDVGIAALAAGCPLLQEFDASETNITDAGVVALARGCRDLRKLNMRECKIIGVAAISAIAENCPLISELNLKFCNVDDACLHSIAQHCRNIHSLNIYEAKVSVMSVISVIKACRMLDMICCADCFGREEDRMSIRQCQRGFMVIDVYWMY